MPYITKADRLQFERAFAAMPPANTAGELNYLFSRIAARYIAAHGLSYQRANDVVGALDGAKAEFQRRTLADYEDAKLIANGDVEP
jgi:hypothetical protein